MIELNVIELMKEAIFMAMDEHGILCDDGHWMTEEELYALPDEEVITLCNLCYGKA